MKPIFRQLGVDSPILLAPMANVSGGLLARAISKAGGLGIIGGGYCDRDWVFRELDFAENTSVGVGFITWKLCQSPTLLDEVLERKPKAIFLSFGDIGPFETKIRNAGIPLIAQVQTVHDAQDAVAKGADIIVAQGCEAGGHGGARGTLALVPAVRDAIGDTPLVAAGGIADGRGAAAAMILGADAVLCGTAFYATHESLASPEAKALAVAARGDETRRSSVFDGARGINWPHPWTLRARSNAFHERWVEAPERIGALDRDAFACAVAAGDPDAIPVIVGEAVDQVYAIEPAAEVFSRLAEDAGSLLAAASNRLSELWNGKLR